MSENPNGTQAMGPVTPEVKVPTVQAPADTTAAENSPMVRTQQEEYHESRFKNISQSESDSEYEGEEDTQPHRRPSKTFKLAEAQRFSDQLIKAFRPLEWFMKILFRFPLYKYSSLEHGTYHYMFSFKTKSFQVFQAVGFLITALILLIVLMLILFNLLGTFLNFPGQTKQGLKSAEQVRVSELFIFQRNIVPVIMMVTCLINACVGSINFYTKRHFAARCITFWTESAGLIRTNLAKGVLKYMVIVLCVYLTFIILLIGLTAAQFIPVASGAPGVLAVLIFRAFIPHIFLLDHFWIVRTICAVFLFYIMLVSKIYMLLFMFQCKLLTNAFSVWNERLDRVLHRGESNAKKFKKSKRRIGFLHLFKDHVCLLDMMEGSDALFATAAETYFATQLLSICFELYYFFRSQFAKDEFFGTRILDGIYVLVYVTQSLFILYVVSKSAADVGQSAMDGIEIIRRKGLLGRRTDEDLYFMLSMYMSFNGHYETAPTGAKYFVMNNEFLVSLVAILFSNFIILIQFSPKLSYTAVTNREKSFTNSSFIEAILINFEGTRIIW